MVTYRPRFCQWTAGLIVGYSLLIVGCESRTSGSAFDAIFVIRDDEKGIVVEATPPGPVPDILPAGVDYIGGKYQIDVQCFIVRLDRVPKIGDLIRLRNGDVVQITTDAATSEDGLWRARTARQ